MGPDTSGYLARVRLDPEYQPYLPASALPAEPVLVVGYRAAFATAPLPGTPLTAFPGTVPAATRQRHPVMGLVRVEYATEVVTTSEDGTSHTQWEENLFAGFPSGISWYLVPAEPVPATGRWAIASGSWAASGRQAVLPCPVTTGVPGAPTVVAIHDHDPHTGRRHTS